MATNYDVNYNDERFKDVESDKQEALSDLENTYSGMINSSDDYYKAQIDASKQWADNQTELQKQQHEQDKKEIEQQKEQTKKDYIKEQSGAYVDWRKQSNEYGAESEQMAATGLTNTGYSESSQVSMYNTYQNRVASARESYNQAVMNFDNAIAQAKIQNSSILAEIAYEAQKQQLELSLQGFQYKNQLLLDKADKKTALESEYYKRYQDVLAQINQENALAEQARQYDESMAFQREQFAWQQEQAKKSYRSSDNGNDDDDDNSGILKDDNTISAKEQALKDIERGGVSDARDAMNLLSRCGIDPAKTGTPLLDSTVWYKAKRIGVQTSEFEGVSDYREYLEHYCVWAINNFA